jgi:fructose transport system permease protein
MCEGRLLWSPFIISKGGKTAGHHWAKGRAMSDQGSATKVISDFEATLNKADTKVAEFETRKDSLMDKVRSFLQAYNTAIPVFVLLLSVIVFGFTSDGRFFTANNLSTVFQQVTVIGILAIAQTIIILTAGIDLSVGVIMILSSVIMGKLAVELGVPVPVAILLGGVAGGVMGYLNGLLITRLKLPPFIVTLGTYNIYIALKLWYSGSQSIRGADTEALAPLLTFMGWPIFKIANKESMFNGLTLNFGGVSFILLAVLIWYVLNRTAWGRHVYAIGDDENSALLAGVQTDRMLRSVYTVAGVICAFGAFVLIGRVGGNISPLGGDTANLDSITAVVIGGTSLFGGRGSIVGSVLGALIVGVFRNGLFLSGVELLWQEFAVGILIIAAVAIDQWIRKASA